jgi:hypothetical protein
MSVYPSADNADVFACYKQKQPVKPLPELDPALAAQIRINREEREAFDGLPRIVRDTFKLVDDLQRICHDGCALDNDAIGSIQAKLIILRICLNIHHGVSTDQIHDPFPDA